MQSRSASANVTAFHADDDDASIEVVPDESRSFPWMRVAVGVVVVAGVVFRAWLAFGRLGQPDSDEAVVGLMALRLLRHGEIGTFYWGQPYGGSLQAVLVAPFLALFGTNVVGLKTASVLLGLSASWLTWRIARHYYAQNVAVAAGCISLFWPATLVWFGTKERGFYPLTAALGLGCVLCAVNIDERPRQLAWWLGLGVTAGLALWMSPNVLYYAPAVALWLVLRGHLRQVRGIVIAAFGLLAGASPFLIANVRNEFQSFYPFTAPHPDGYLLRFKYFFTTALPFGLGLRKAWTRGAWIISPTFGVVVCLLLLGALAATIFMPAMRRRSIGWLQAPDVTLLAASAFVFTLFNQNPVLFEGRYVYFVASILPLVACRVMTIRAGRIVVSAVVAVTTVAFISDVHRLQNSIRPRTAAMARALEAAGYHTAVSQYWIGYQMTFESDEKIIATQIPSRYRPYDEQVVNSAPAYVFRPSNKKDRANEIALEARLDHLHIAYRVVRAGDYEAVLPATRFAPAMPRKYRK